MMNCPHCGVHIDEHPASRCLAVWVAVDVMEWEKTEQRPIVHKDWLDYPQEWYKTPDGRIVNITNVPDYPGSIAAAWEVVEKLGSLDLNDAGHGWYCRLHPDPLFAFVLADTAPLAICRAAIKASQ